MNSTVSETVRSIQSATGFDARHLPDVEKFVGDCFHAGRRSATTVEHVPALTDGEISLLRGLFRASAAARGAVTNSRVPAKAGKKK